METTGRQSDGTSIIEREDTIVVETSEIDISSNTNTANSNLPSHQIPSAVSITTESHRSRLAANIGRRQESSGGGSIPRRHHRHSNNRTSSSTTSRKQSSPSQELLRALSTASAARSPTAARMDSHPRVRVPPIPRNDHHHWGAPVPSHHGRETRSTFFDRLRDGADEARVVPRAASSYAETETLPSSSTSMSTSMLTSSSVSVSNTGPALSQGEWKIVEEKQGVPGGVPPCQRSLHSAALLNGCMLVFGGYDGQARRNDFHSFSFQEKRWSLIYGDGIGGAEGGGGTLSQFPSPRDRHTSVVHRNSFYVFGGFDGTSRINDFFKFDFNSMTWQQIYAASGSAPTPRHSHSAVVHQNSMFVFGGYDGSYRSDLHEYDFDTNAWSPVATQGRTPRARYRATCVVHNDTMILFGGHDGTRHLADVHFLDLETKMWRAIVPDGSPPISRDSHISIVHGHSMFVFGGSTGSAMNDIHELKLPTIDNPVAKWHPVMASGSVRHRFCHVGVVYDDSLYIFGGYDGTARLNDFIRLQFHLDDLKYEIPPSTLVSDLRSFLNNENLSDVTFIVEGQPVHAHKMMLTRCPYFQAMLCGEMREAKQSTIHIKEVGYSIFLAVLEYLYTDDIDISVDSAMELFVAADLFGIPRLQSMCEKTMLESITVENAATIFHAADMHSAKTLRSKALKYILTHFEIVSKTTSFEEMARGNVELVFEILKGR